MVTLPSFISGILRSARERELVEDNRASEAWRRINLKPYSAVFSTPAGTLLPSQTVRLESDNSSLLLGSTAGTAPVRRVIIYGIINHITLPDTDMKEGYTFIFSNDEYRCTDIIVTLGEIQGIWESSG